MLLQGFTLNFFFLTKLNLYSKLTEKKKFHVKESKSYIIFSVLENIKMCEFKKQSVKKVSGEVHVFRSVSWKAPFLAVSHGR